MGNPGAVLLGGRVAGLWTARMRDRGADLSVQLLEPLSAGQRRRLEEKLEAFAAFQDKQPGKFQISEM